MGGRTRLLDGRLFGDLGRNLRGNAGRTGEIGGRDVDRCGGELEFLALFPGRVGGGHGREVEGDELELGKSHDGGV